MDRELFVGSGDKKPSLIYMGNDTWFSIHQRPQQLAKCLSEYFRVLYVDPVCFSILGNVRNHLRGDKSRVFRSTLQMLQQDLFLFRLAPLLPIPLDSQWANELVLHFLARSLPSVMREAEIEDPALILAWPLDLPLAGKLGESLLCYDCMDNYAAFKSNNSQRANFIVNQEETLLARAELVFASAKPIHTRLSKRHQQVYLVKNAVSKWFLSYQNESLPPADWPEGDGPVIGYVGMIADWFDIDAVVQIATRNPTWRIVIIGPSVLDLRPYSTIPNLYFLGSKPHSELPNYVSRFDVSLIPFLLNELTLDVNPVKVYEYFALGTPVVAARLPELVEFSDLLYLADNTEQFVEATEKAVQELQLKTREELEALRSARRDVARQNTWEMRAAAIRDTISAYRQTHKPEVVLTAS